MKPTTVSDPEHANHAEMMACALVTNPSLADQTLNLEKQAHKQKCLNEMGHHDELHGFMGHTFAATVACMEP